MEAQIKKSMSVMMPPEGYTVPTEEDAAAFRALIENAKEANDGYSVVHGILEEELEFCFEGGRSVEDTIEIIQKRVQLYLDEIR